MCKLKQDKASRPCAEHYYFPLFVDSKLCVFNFGVFIVKYSGNKRTQNTESGFLCVHVTVTVINDFKPQKNDKSIPANVYASIPKTNAYTEVHNHEVLYGKHCL